MIPANRGRGSGAEQAIGRQVVVVQLGRQLEALPEALDRALGLVQVEGHEAEIQQFSCLDAASTQPSREIERLAVEFLGTPVVAFAASRGGEHVARAQA